MSRNYESNGPDIKIRGNAGHIAEKYATLARDALSNGDTVMAENYYQHAEHYNRLIAAAQAQRAEEQAQQANRNSQPESEDREEADSDTTEARKDASSSSDAGEEVEKGQRGGRPRRTRRSAPSDEGEARDQDGERVASAKEDKSQANGKSNGSDADAGSDAEPEAKSVEAESISDDAASLPDSITGGLRAEEA